MNTLPKKYFFLSVLAGVLGLTIFCLIGIYFISSVPKAIRPTASSPGDFVQPLGAVGPESLTIGARVALEKRLQELVAHETQQGNVSGIGIYFRDLNNGPIVRINDDADFSPASLLKLPLAIWYYKEASSSRELLTEEIQYTGPNGVSVEHFPGNRMMQPGRIYSIKELIELMVEESDNDATAVLAEYASSHNTNTVYQDLGIEPVGDYSTYHTNVRNYSAFFRILYTASYLNRDYSNELLEILTKSSFSRGIVAGVPTGIVVAHKFGERTVDPDKNINQLHDCGIVYVPKTPYILCVMTQGRDYDELAKVISEVSRETYMAVTSGKDH